MSLTQAEKAAGREFRSSMRLTLAADGTAARCNGFIREYRHACPKQGGASLAIRMRENTALSPVYFSRKERGEWQAWPEGQEPDGLAFVGIPAGWFTFIWLDGHCSCGFKVRSPGRVVLTGGENG